MPEHSAKDEPLDASLRVLRARIGAHALHAQYDSRLITAPAREAARSALDRRLLSEIDPGNELPEAERARRLEHARRAHFSKLAFQSAKARRRRSREFPSEPRGGGDGGHSDA